jgi:hypothetical protein
MFTAKISTDNAAFAHPGGAYELERILREIGETVRFCVTDATTETASAKLRDANGNEVGSWSLNAPEDELEGALSLSPEDSGTAPGAHDAIMRGDERALAIRVLESFAAGTGPLTPADARRTARIIRAGLEPVAPLDEVLRANRVLPKGEPGGEASAGEPDDQWSIMPMLRAYDMDDGFGIVARPTGLALMMVRGELALPMELSALALAEIARGEWNELVRQARHMVEAFENADGED